MLLPFNSVFLTRQPAVTSRRTFLPTSGDDGLLTWFMSRHQIVTLLAVHSPTYFMYLLRILPFQLTLTYSLVFFLCCKPVCISPTIVRAPCVLNTSQVGSRKCHEVLPARCRNSRDCYCGGKAS